MTTLQIQTSLFTEEKSTSSQEVSPANRTAMQESDSGQKMSAIYGPKCLEQLEKFNHVSSWGKTFLASLVGMEGWSSKRCKLSWKLKGTKYNRYYFQLVGSTLPIKENEFGLLPTPLANDSKSKENAPSMEYSHLSTISSYFKRGLLPTPLASEIHHPKRVEKLKATGATGLRVREPGEAGANGLMDYLDWKGMLPAPKARDWKGEGFDSDLPTRFVKGSNKANGKTSQLNPRFVMEMMGFPPDWTELPFLSGETNQSKEVETQLSLK
jgi:hypothetical protein